MKKTLALIMAALLIFCMVSCAKNEEGADDEETKKVENADDSLLKSEVGTFEFQINDNGEYEIAKYTPASVKVIDIELPKTTANDREVVGIGKNAFKAQNSIKSVKIPDSYQYIGKQAFYDCDSLTTVTMANSVTNIYAGAFQACDKLETVTVSKSLKILSEYAFAGCVALTSADLSGEASRIEKGAFFGCSALTSVTLSDKLESVDKAAFIECPKLTFTEFGNAKYLGNEANPHLALISAANLNIESCTVNDNTKIIAKDALANCGDLKKVTLGAALTFVNGDCFTNSASIEYTEFENARYLGTEANPYMVMVSVILSSAESITVHNDTAIITDTAFANCFKLLDINYEKTADDWGKIKKTDTWNHDMDIIVHCSDKKIEA